MNGHWAHGRSVLMDFTRASSKVYWWEIICLGSLFGHTLDIGMICEENNASHETRWCGLRTLNRNEYYSLMSAKIFTAEDPRVQAFVGEKRNRLTAIRFIRMDKGRQIWEFKCDCGSLKIMGRREVEKEIIGSCGCLHHEMLLRRNTIHGHASRTNRHPIYGIWKNMRDRCFNPNNKHYSGWGGRGITIDERWNDFEKFLEDMGPSYQSGLLLDRRNNDGNYCKENCRWATSKEQNSNKRNTRHIAFNGRTLTIAGWGLELFGRRFLVHTRLKRGWTIERALTTPCP